MKKSNIIFTVLFLTIMFAVSARAPLINDQPVEFPQTVDSTDNSTFEIIGNRSVLKVTDYNGLNSNIMIRSNVRSMSVVIVGERAFYNKGLTAVRLPDSIVLIERQAFAGNEITHIIIPSNVMIFNDSFDLDFPAFYTANESRAGIYIYVNGRWEYQQGQHTTAVAPQTISPKEDKSPVLTMEPYGRIGMGVGLWDYGYSMISPRMYLNLGLMVMDYKNFKLGFTAEGGAFLGAAFPDFEDAGISYGFYFGSFIEFYFLDIFGIAVGGGMNKVHFATKNDLLPDDFLPFFEVDLMIGDEDETLGVYFRYYINDINGFANKFAVGIKRSIDF